MILISKVMEAVFRYSGSKNISAKLQS